MTTLVTNRHLKQDEKKLLSLNQTCSAYNIPLSKWQVRHRIKALVTILSFLIFNRSCRVCVRSYHSCRSSLMLLNIFTHGSFLPSCLFTVLAQCFWDDPVKDQIISAKTSQWSSVWLSKTQKPAVAAESTQLTWALSVTSCPFCSHMKLPRDRAVPTATPPQLFLSSPFFRHYLKVAFFNRASFITISIIISIKSHSHFCFISSCHTYHQHNTCYTYCILLLPARL